MACLCPMKTGWNKKGLVLSDDSSHQVESAATYLGSGVPGVNCGPCASARMPAIAQVFIVICYLNLRRLPSCVLKKLLVGMGISARRWHYARTAAPCLLGVGLNLPHRVAHRLRASGWIPPGAGDEASRAPSVSAGVPAEESGAAMLLAMQVRVRKPPPLNNGWTDRHIDR